MVKTYSQMVDLGSKAPLFNLPCPQSGEVVSLSHLKSELATVIIFMCNHCPFVIHLIDELQGLAESYSEKGIQFIAINSNDIEKYPQDSPQQMIEFSNQHKLSFPYLFDESQEIAKAFNAACTPDFFVYDKELALIYRGQFDGSRPGNDLPVTGSDLKTALDCTINNAPLTAEQKPSVGCNIKWRDY